MAEGSAPQAQAPQEQGADDARLVARCREGDQEAWGELVERYSRYVFAISAQGFRLSNADAEDVFQEVFARTYERLDQLRDDAAIRPWLAQLTRRLCVDRLRQSARVSPSEDVELMAEGEGEEVFERIDQAMGVRDALSALSSECQEVLDRFFARDQSYRVISDSLGIPQGTIASRISRCLAKLRSDLGA
jgi:RNA polymerase sigma-70 factor (ECF subfamily)